MKKRIGMLLGTMIALAVLLAGPGRADESPLGPLPSSFTGTLPCADCEGIDTRLDLFPDGAFYLHRVYRGHASDAFDEIGSWRFDAPTGVLALSDAGDGPMRFSLVGEDELRLLDRQGRRIESELDYSLRRTEGLNELEPRLVLRGMYTYAAEVGTIVECRTGRRLPVWDGGDSTALEKAYRDSRAAPDEPLLVELEGRIAWLPPREGDGLVPTLVVEKFRAILPDRTCETRPPQADLLDTYWKLIRLEDEDLTAASGREPHLVLRGEGRFKAYDGCNRILGSFSAIKERMKFSDAVSTKMVCPDPAPAAGRFAALLERIATYRIDGRQLDLQGEDGRTLLRFEAVEPK